MNNKSLILEEKLSNLNLEDNFFVELKRDYPNFKKWINKNANRKAYTSYVKNNLVGLLILKIENNEEFYPNINPKFNKIKRLKICTFKISNHDKNIEKEYINIIFNYAALNRVEEVYYTIYNNSKEKKNLIDYLCKFGFYYYGNNNKEEVYIKKFHT